ncbi:hypothetical protein ACFQ60_00850 [Streptomyces zhihengii]
MDSSDQILRPSSPASVPQLAVPSTAASEARTAPSSRAPVWLRTTTRSSPS